MTRVITLGNKKGGAGKTYATQHIAGLAAMFGHKVCVVDLCASRNLTKGLTSIAFPDHQLDDEDNVDQLEAFLAAWSEEFLTASDMMLAQDSDKPVLTLPLNLPRKDFKGRVEDPDIHLVIGSATVDMTSDENPMNNDEGIDNFRWSINRLVENNDFDFVFLDIGPNNNASFHAALYSSTDVAIVARCDPSNRSNTAEFYLNVQQIFNYRNEEGTPAAYHGLILTDLDTMSRVSVDMAAKYRERYEPIFSSVLTRRRAVSACHAQEYVWCISGSSAAKAREDLESLWKELLGQIQEVDAIIPSADPTIDAEVETAYQEGGRRNIQPPV